MKLCGKVNWCRLIWLIIIITLPGFSLYTSAQNINLPPVLDVGVSNQHAEVNSLFTYTIPANAFKDENNDPLTYSLNNLPAWLSYDAATRTLSGTPTAATATPHTITVNASDGILSRSTNFTIKVHPENSTYAAFTMNTQMGCNFRSISFTNLSKGVVGNSYEWDFGNGDAPSSEEDPNVIFNQPGNYNVRLTINKNQPNERTHGETITIYPRPQPIIRDISTGCEPHAATLISDGGPASVNGVTGGAEEYYSWHISGVPGHYTLNRETETQYLPSGDYRVNLRVMDQYGCYQQNTQAAPLKIFEKPKAFFTYTKANSCSPSPTMFIDRTEISDGQITNYIWTVDGQNQGVNNDTLIYNFTQAGEYTVTLQNSSSNGCQSEPYSETITFNSNNTADFNIEPRYCLGETIELSAITSPEVIEYSWDIGNNGEINSHSQNFTHQLTAPGTYPVKLTVLFSDGCTRQVIKTLNVEDILADFDYQVSYDCDQRAFNVEFQNTSVSNIGSPITGQQWYLVSPISETLISNNASFEHSFSQAGTQNIKLIVESSNGCQTIIEKSIFLQRPSLSFSVSGEYSGCFTGQNIIFQANFDSPFENATSFTWNFGDGQTGSGETTSHSYTGQGVYNVSLSVNTSTGCTYTTTANNAVSLTEPPEITGVEIIQDGDMCFSQGVDLNIHFTEGTEQIRVNTPQGSVDILNLEDSPELFFYQPTDTGYMDFSFIASRFGCESVEFEMFDLVRVNEPLARFTPSQNPYCNDPPFLASFENQSKYSDAGTTFTWNFGDGTITTFNTSESPLHEYNQTGTYTVTLTVSNPNTGCSDTYTDEISIYLFDEAEDIVSADKTSGCAPLTVNFSQEFSSSIAGDNYNPGDLVWHFIQNGIVIDTIVSSASNVQYTFQQPGLYSVRLFEEEGGCNFNILKENFISASGPIVDFSYTPPQVCLNTEVSFNGIISKPSFDTAEPSVYYWQFGDGQTASTRNATNTYTQADTISVSYTVTDSEGCATTIEKPDLFEIIQFEPLFELNDTVFCSNSQVDINNTSTGNIRNYHWDFEGNGSIDITTTINQTVSHTFASAGKYIITLTAEAPDGCTKIFDKEIRIIDATADFSAAERNIGCAPSIAHFSPFANDDDVLSYLWDFGDGNTSNEREPENMYLLPGSYAVTLTVAFRGGCTRQIRKNNFITVDGAYGELTYDNTPGCAPYSVNLEMKNMNRVDYIEWYFGTGEIRKDTVLDNATNFKIDFTYDTLGYRTPKVILTDLVCGQYEYSNPSLGAVYTSTAPVPNFTTNLDTICVGAPLQFTDLSHSPDPEYGIQSWNWLFGTSLNDSSTEQNPTFAYSNQGIFSPELIVFNELGCSDTLTKANSIHIIRNDVTSDFDLTNQDGFICPWQTIDAISNAQAGQRSHIVKYEWDFGDGYTEGNTTEKYTYTNNHKGQEIHVIHKVTDDKFCTDSTSRTVEISNLQAAFGYDPQPVFRGSTVDFSDQSVTDAGTDFTNWNWNFGNGSPSQSNESNPTHIGYSNIIDNNEVSLIVTNSIGCIDTTSQVFSILNNPPILDNFSILLVEDREYTFTAEEFTSHFEPADPGQSMEYIRIESNANNGTFYFNGQPYILNAQIPFSEIHLLTFFPAENWHGNTWSYWNAYDGYDWSLNTGIINIEVIENPDPPVLNDIVFNLNKDEIATITRANFIAAIKSVLGSSLDFDSLWIFTAPAPASAGTLSFNDELLSNYPHLITSIEIDNLNRIFSYSPAQNFNGQITFQWNAYDGYNFAEQNARVIINYINQAPVAVNDTFVVYEAFDMVNHSMEGYQNILDNDYDLDIYDTYTVHRVNGNVARTVQGEKGYGSLIWNTAGTWTFRENYANTQKLAGGQVVEEIFRYTITDGTDISQEAYIIFRIIGRNNPPTAINDTIRITEKDISTSFNALDNDYDIDEGDEIFMTLIEGSAVSPVHVNDFSQLSWNSDGECTFEITQNIDTLSAGQSIKVEYTYTISDDSLATDEALIVIIISGINDPPVAVNDTLYVSENDLIISPEWSLLDNDYDVDSEQIWVTRFNNNTQSPVNTRYAAFDWDAEGYFTYNRYVHDDIRQGLDTLSHHDVITDLIPYRISDTEGENGNAWLVLIIQGENDPPVAVADSITIMQNMESITSVQSILANDYDVDRGDSIMLLDINGDISGEVVGEFGHLIWDEFGNFTYYINHEATASIPRDANEYEKFPYTISDRLGETDTDTLVITIVGVNYPPTAIDVLIGIYEKDTITNIYPNENGLLINSFDIDGDPISVVIPDNNPPAIYNGIFGTLAYFPDGEATYTLYETLDSLKIGEQVRDTIPFTISDTHNATSTANLIVIITGRNDPPVAQDIYISIPEDSLIVPAPLGSDIAMLTNAYDVDGDAMRITEVNGSSNKTTVDVNGYGTLNWETNGSYTFVNNREKTATIPMGDTVDVVFVFVVADPHPAGRDTAKITISIHGLNNPPIARPMYYSTFDVNPIIVEAESDMNMMANSSDIDGQVTQVTHVNESPQNVAVSEQGFGVLTWNNNGSFTYQPDPLIARAIAPDDSIRDYFSFTVIDNHMASASSSIYIDIKGINYPPVADNVIIRFENELIYAPLDTTIIPHSVYDFEGDPISLNSIENDITGIVNGEYGTITWNQNGEFTFTPSIERAQTIKPNEFISEGFAYVVSDIHGAEGEAFIIAEFIGINDPIEAIDDYDTIPQNTYLVHNVVANDINPDDNFDYGSLRIDVQPHNGRAFVNSATGEIYYTPNENFNGSDSLQYYICDEGMPVYCDNAWLYIEVTPVNLPPEATNLLLRTNVNTPVPFNYFNQVEDIDDGIDPGSLEIAQHPGNGTINSQNSNITYAPDSLFTGIDEFVYSLSDFEGERAYVIVNVIIQDDGFGAQDDYAETMQRIPVDVNILENDTLNGFNPNPLSVDIKVFPKNGTAHYNPDTWTVTYQPHDNFNGTDSLYYSVSANTGNIDFAKLVITVNPTNKPIVANNDAATTLINIPVTIRILDNDYDWDDGIDSTSVVIIEGPDNGVAFYNETTGQVVYTPHEDYAGPDYFIYTVCDLNDTAPSCDEAIVSILVRDPSSTLRAYNDSYTMFENDTLDLIYPNHPLDNDTFENIETIDFAIINEPLNGTYLFDENTRIITYIPDENFNGLDWISYRLCEGSNCDFAEINIWVEPVNTPPVANDDYYVVNDNAAKRLYVLVNDYDVDGHLVWSTLDTIESEGPRLGTIEFDRLTGTILYTPTVNKGIDEFTYQICDNDGACAEATVTILIELGTIIFHEIETLEDTPVSFEIVPLLEKYNLFFDVIDSEEILAPGIGEWELINENTQVLYTPGQDLNGNDYFELFLFSNNDEVMAELRISVWVEPVNDPPVAMPDTVIWEMESNTTITTFEHILKNDYDVDGDPLIITIGAIDKAEQFNITFNETDSTITIFTENIDWCDAWFTYEISDPDGETDIGHVLIIPDLDIYNLVAVDDYFEVLMNNNLSTPSDMGSTLDVLANDSLLDNQRCIIDSMQIITPPLYAEVEVDTENNVIYTPKIYFYGLDSLQYRIVDIWGQADSAWVIIDVQFRNIPPVAVDDQVVLELGETIFIPILENDYDPDYPFDSIVVSNTYLNIEDLPKFGTAVLDPSTGIVSYTPEEMTCEDDWFTYTIFDTHGDSATATVFIIKPEEAPIVANPDTVKTWPGVPVEFNVLANDLGFFFPWVDNFTQPSQGNVTQIGDSSFVFYPDPSFFDNDMMTYELVSPCGNTATGIVVFMIEELRVPEIITPNNDGKNDALIIDGIEYFPNSWLRIFNRYGHVVYQKRGYDNSWDGYSNQGSLGGNSPLPSGTYYYTLIYNDEQNHQTGIIYIFR